MTATATDLMPESLIATCERLISARLESGDYDFVDSVRYARTGNAAEMHEFAETRSCCGCEEWRETVVDSGVEVEVVLGFNYGH